MGDLILKANKFKDWVEQDETRYPTIPLGRDGIMEQLQLQPPMQLLQI